jgi:hypothetical protein
LRKALRPAAFFDDFREPGTSEKAAAETTTARRSFVRGHRTREAIEKSTASGVAVFH